MSGLSIEFVEGKIVEIIKEPLGAEQAADEAIAFLDRLDPSLLGQLAGLGEAGLLNLFQSRPQLKPATANMPRLMEFIKAFLKYAAEHDGGEAQAKPN